MSQYKTDICPECGGSRFSGYGTGYDAVCDSCGGLGEIIVGVKAPAMDKETKTK